MRFKFFADRPLEQYRKSDPLIFVSMILLLGLGILALAICSRHNALAYFGDSLYFVKRQLLCVLLGTFVFFAFVSMGMDSVRRILPLIVFGSVFLCLLTLIPGVGRDFNGARRWLRIPLFGTFQPSELVKLAMVLFLANYFDKISRLDSDEKSVLVPVVFLLVFSGAVLLQQDFSTSAFILSVGICMFILAGEKVRWLGPMLFILAPIGGITILLKPYRLNRLIGFFDQDSFSQTFNYQISNAKKAISAGGFWGQGFGSGLSKINTVPEVQTDYIFAGWAEATGLFGVLIYFILLAFFAWRILRCALTTTDRFASYAVFGFLISIVGQSLMNVAVVVGVLPTTGVPLPFFSSGGSSIIVTMAMCGFIVSASRLDKVGGAQYGDDRSLYTGLGNKK